MKNVIIVKNLTKRYQKLIAVDNVSFDVKKGEIFGLLGENGAGKTTTLEMIEGLRRPTEGDITVLDCDIKTEMKCVKERIGVQLQSSAYYNFLTLKEILELFASFYTKHNKALDLLSLVDLSEKANSRISALSGGQKQRFSIIASLVNDPEVVFLDEPTTGLDPIARRNLWELISKIKSQGKTIILTTHYMEEAELLCDRIAIMDKGKILALNETHKLIDNAEYPYSITFTTISKVAENEIKKLQKFGLLEKVLAKENQYQIKIKDKDKLNQAVKIVQKIDPANFTIGHATLEDYFIELTGKTIEE